MAKQGWISVHRQLQDHWLWQDKPYTKGQAWIDLLFSASHCDTRVMFDCGVIEVKEGSFITSMSKLERRWGWSNRKVMNFLDMLQADRMIERRSTKRYTTITIENYTFYQNEGRADAPLEHHSSTTDAPLKHTINNSNNENNSNKNKKKIFKPPTVDEVQEYCVSRNNGIDAEHFIDFYTARGWMVGKNKMSDWKAAVRTWERRTNKGDKDNGKANETDGRADESPFSGLQITRL